MSQVHVPDISGPKAPLCWKQGHHTMVRCDRASGHAGLHSWEMAAEIDRLVRVLTETQERAGTAEDALTTLRERHAAAIEAAFTEAYQLGSDDNEEGSYLRPERWLASEARKGVTP